MRYYLAVVVDGEPEVVVVFPVSFDLPLFPDAEKRSKIFVFVIELYEEPKQLVLTVEELTNESMCSEIVARESHR